ncbi:BnaAnng39830D [Brassica napus]|uniref:BnaAnng39830D protein n=1 Tax=Brassica napus TaxID=3708 RepID=A0A078K084_BRANA|nr:BnaAnng39830D [Brassica napus]
MPSELLKACYDEGNPSTLYIKGVQFFYSLDLHEEGLSLMKRAADAGYERAVYTHAMTRAIFEGGGKHFDDAENIEKLMATEFDHAHNNGLDLHWSG